MICAGLQDKGNGYRSRSHSRADTSLLLAPKLAQLLELHLTLSIINRLLLPQLLNLSPLLAQFLCLVLRSRAAHFQLLDLCVQVRECSLMRSLCGEKACIQLVLVRCGFGVLRERARLVLRRLFLHLLHPGKLLQRRSEVSLLRFSLSLDHFHESLRILG